jgi:hypothetical protein
MELPNVPLFKELNELGTIPQIALAELLLRYSGKECIEVGSERRFYTVT